MSLLRVEGLAVDFPQYGGGNLRVVEGVNLTVNQGEIICLVGESGCGKSVTVRSLFNLLPPPGRRGAGSVVFDGKDLDAMAPEELRALCGTGVGYVFQDPMTYLNPLLTVGAQIAEAVAGTTRFANDPALCANITELLGELGIGDPERVARSFPHQLSGGMRQRILIAMAIARRPRLLILDEPTTALDVTVQAQIVDLIRAIQKHTGCGLIFVTHDFGLVAELADRVYVMYAGQLVEEGTVDAIFGAPRHPYTKGLIECVIPVGTGSALRTIHGEVPDPRTPPPGCRFAMRCPRATDICRTETPALLAGQLSGERAGKLAQSAAGLVRCHHAGNEGLSPAADVRVSGAFVPRGTGQDGAGPHGPGSRIPGSRIPGSRAPEPSPGAQGSKPLPEPGRLRALAAYKTFPVRGGAFGGKATVHAVNGVTLELAPGEIFALVGESGSGKSTLGRLAAGLEEIGGGEILIGDENPSDRLQKRARPLAQMVFQDPYSSLNPRKTIRHTLSQPLRNFGICRPEETGERLVHLLERIGLTPAREFLDRHPHELSGGQRQRVVLARALAAEPKVLVADEPVSSLDMSTRAQILGLIQELRRDMGLTVLLITHDLAVVSAVADRMGVMYLGRLFEVSPAAEGVADPLQPYSRMLVSAVPLPDPVLSRNRERLLMLGEPPSPVRLPSGCYLHPRCPNAVPQCATLAPELREVRPGRYAACHML